MQQGEERPALPAGSTPPLLGLLFLFTPRSIESLAKAIANVVF